MHRQLALALVLSALAAAVPAAAQEAPLTGVLNCTIKAIQSCKQDRCRSGSPGNGEISFDFDRGSACIRRGGDCQQPRPFTVVHRKGRTHVLVFAEHGMIVRIAPDWSMVGAEVQHDRSTTFFGKCGRG